MPTKNSRSEMFLSESQESDHNQDHTENPHPNHTHIRWTVREAELVLSGEGLRELIDEIEWVRLVIFEDQRMGIGFFRKPQTLRRRAGGARPTLGPTFDLVHLVATGDVGLVRRVSMAESAVVLRDLAELEQEVLPDIESNSAGWLRWLEGLAQRR